MDLKGTFSVSNAPQPPSSPRLECLFSPVASAMFPTGSFCGELYSQGGGGALEGSLPCEGVQIAFLALVWASLLFRCESRGQGVRSAAEVSLNYPVPLPAHEMGPRTLLPALLMSFASNGGVKWRDDRRRTRETPSIPPRFSISIVGWDCRCEQMPL